MLFLAAQHGQYANEELFNSGTFQSPNSPQEGTNKPCADTDPGFFRPAGVALDSSDVVVITQVKCLDSHLSNEGDSNILDIVGH